MIVQNQPRVKPEWSPVGRTQKTQDYYMPRECPSVGGDYWALKRDPDGNVRDRLCDEERRSYLENVADELAFVQSFEPGKILDFGCGPGWFLRELPDWHRFGVEPSLVARAEMKRLPIMVSKSVSLFDRWQFDAITCLHVIEHIPNPLTTVKQLRSMLLPGGWFIISTPDFDSPCAQRFGANYRMLHDPTHCSLFTRASLDRLLRDFGFTIHDVRFPFPDKYATQETFARWHDTSKISPPWPGNWMTFYCTRGTH